MSDHQVEPGWWRAQDGKWYPPQMHPGYAALVAEAQRSASPSFPLPSLQRPPVDSPPPGPGHPSWKKPRALRTRRDWSWFSPDAAFAIASCLGAAALVVILPAVLLVVVLMTASAWATAKAVFRFRDGHGAGAMTLAALVICGGTAVFGLWQVYFAMTSPLVGMEEALPPADTPDGTTQEPFIHWQEFSSGECFDLGLHHRGPAHRRSCKEPHDAEVIGVAAIDSSEAQRVAATTSGDPDGYWDARSEETCDFVHAAHITPPWPSELVAAIYREDPELRPLDPEEPMTLGAKVLCVVFHTHGAKLERPYVTGG